MKHRPRKRFGQNFLMDQAVIENILALINCQPEDNMVEIGPGLGALTAYLINSLAKLNAIEIDRDLCEILRQNFAKFPGLHLINADALTTDYRSFGQNLRIVGNLPYNISTPLLLHLLQYNESIKDMHFMLQKEVVKRITASPGTKDYSRFTVMIQYHCQADFLLEVPPDAFNPPPQVDSAIVRLVPHKAPVYAKVNPREFEKLLAASFSMRRKTLANNLKKIISAEQLFELNIAPQLRPEDITVEEYVHLCNFIQGTK